MYTKIGNHFVRLDVSLKQHCNGSTDNKVEQLAKFSSFIDLQHFIMKEKPNSSALFNVSKYYTIRMIFPNSEQNSTEDERNISRVIIRKISDTKYKFLAIKLNCTLICIFVGLNYSCFYTFPFQLGLLNILSTRILCLEVRESHSLYVHIYIFV